MPHAKAIDKQSSIADQAINSIGIEKFRKNGGQRIKYILVVNLIVIDKEGKSRALFANK